MSNKSSIVDRIDVRTPCNADWDSMIGNDEVRFCEHCVKSVHNLSAMTRVEAEKLVIDSNGKLCIRYRRSEDGTIRTVERPRPLYEITRKVSRLAASAVAVALTVSNSVAAKPALAKHAVTLGREKIKADVSDQLASEETNMLAGRVTDESSNGISGGAITLRGMTTGYQYDSESASFGVYCIDDLPKEPYEISVTAPNFKKLTIKNIDLRAPVTKFPLKMYRGNPSEEIVLDARQMGFFGATMGLMSMTGSPKIPGIDYKALGKFETDKIPARKLNSLTRILALQNAVTANKKERVESLLAVGVELNGHDDPRDNTGKTSALKPPVLFSIENETGDEIVADLVRAGADLNLKDPLGRTAIIKAAQVNNKNAVEILLRYGAHVDDEDLSGATALSFLVMDDNIDAVRMLIDAGADVNHRDASGHTALVQILLTDWHGSANTRDIIRLLKQNGASE